MSNKYSFFYALFFMFSFYEMSLAQSPNATYTLPVEGYFWKDQAAIIQVLDAEILTTSNSQKLPNSTKNKALLEAYKSLLLNAKIQLEKGTPIPEILDNALAVIMNEEGAIPYKRALLANDMNIKKQELQLKLTYK